MLPQQRFDVTRGAVAAPNPDYAGCRTGDLTAFLEVRVLGHDGETAFQREAPYRQVVGTLKTSFPHMERLRKDVREARDQIRLEVLVEQQLHVPTMNCVRSRSAA